jgi:hypothetical protein
MKKSASANGGDFIGEGADDHRSVEIDGQYRASSRKRRIKSPADSS